ncbi:cytochrome c-type biogenesis protein [Sphingomonas sp.]|uniref:cytochrome c-type biogenesis protein n=1 Tax=Sphingomonas sp. TaxID=28214 RepID=UPI002E364BDF|nr:cytochrome c-type biogenesis protein CcmH [Sphingomonas sp.]HEX4693956.1 cytochrome c-type biogenesis protein CcmH [Sphingomonas sp.]
MKRWILLFALVAAPVFAQPVSFADTQLRDPAKEAQARALMATIRCVECQGQSVADSNAPIAGSVRALIRERIRNGETPGQVRAWLIDRYGDYITYDPPLGALTWPLWAAPIVLLVVGVLLARGAFRRRH